MSPATEVQEQYSLDQMAECFTGEDNEMLFPMTTYPLLYKYVAYAQACDAKLQADRATRADKYKMTTFEHGGESFDLVTYNG